MKADNALRERLSGLNQENAMIEFYKLVARYRADIQHEKTGHLIDYWAEVYSGPTIGRFSIRHSHVFQPTEDAGYYYSNTYSVADSELEAEQKVRTWTEKLRASFAYKLS